VSVLLLLTHQTTTAATNSTTPSPSRTVPPPRIPLTAFPGMAVVVAPPGVTVTVSVLTITSFVTETSGIVPPPDVSVIKGPLVGLAPLPCAVGLTSTACVAVAWVGNMGIAGVRVGVSKGCVALGIVAVGGGAVGTVCSFGLALPPRVIKPSIKNITNSAEAILEICLISESYIPTGRCLNHFAVPPLLRQMVSAGVSSQDCSISTSPILPWCKALAVA
jgi:hypothetical protein